MEAIVGALLAELAEEPGLVRPRRLTVGAVLGGGHLDMEEVAGEAVVALLSELAPESGLCGVWLGDVARVEGAAERLVRVLGRFPGLSHVRVAGLDAGGVRMLVGAVAGHTGLRSLSLAGVAGGWDGELCDMLSRSCVVHVALAGEIGDAGGRAIAGALRGDPRWRTLRLAEAGIGVAGAEAIVGAAVRSRHLVRLELGRPLAPGCLARLAHNANRGRVPPPPELARLRAALPPEPQGEPPLPWGVDAGELAVCLRVLSGMSERTDIFRGGHPRVAALREAVLLLARGERRVTARRDDGERAAERARRREEDRRRDAATGIRRGRGAVRGPMPELAGEAAGEVGEPGAVSAERARRREEERRGDAMTEDEVGSVRGARAEVPGEDAGELSATRACYVCKRGYRRLHHFYDRLCPECAESHYARREEQVDLRGRTALVTGGRVKIGHAVALRLLHWGARVIVTTRFPRDAARRFAEEDDFAGFVERLEIYPLDLRDVPAVERFAGHLDATLSRLDILINNAAQTVWRPPGYYAELLAQEAAGLPAGEAVVRALPGGQAPEGASPARSPLFPAGSDDGFGQPLDLRASNSWRLRLHEVEAIELVEVQLINAVAPFLLTARLRRLMAGGDMAFVVHVSAPEGRFYRPYKSPFHPHTNMAKAGLNMLTRTSAEDFAGESIYMNSVDTGWVSNENPRPIAEAMQAEGFAPPLDVVDAAARVCDPIVRGYRDGAPVWGLFLKDYRAISW